MAQKAEKRQSFYCRGNGVSTCIKGKKITKEPWGISSGPVWLALDPNMSRLIMLDPEE